MKKMIKTGIAVAAALGICGAVIAYGAGLIEQKSVLEGTFISTVTPGTAVHEGDVLVTVNSLAGPVPAARAEADGVVKEVLVAKGQKIHKQDPVVMVEAR